MFAKGEFALGDMRVFSRYTVAPLSMLTCGFLDLRAGARTEPRRMLPSLIAYIIEGSGESVQDGVRVSFRGRRCGDHPAVHDVPLPRAFRNTAFALGCRKSDSGMGKGFCGGIPWLEQYESESASEQKIAALFQVTPANSYTFSRHNALRLVSIQTRRRKSHWSEKIRA